MLNHWNVEQAVALGILVWIWNRLGLSDRATLIGNIVFAAITIFFFFVKQFCKKFCIVFLSCQRRELVYREYLKYSDFCPFKSGRWYLWRVGQVESRDSFKVEIVSSILTRATMIWCKVCNKQINSVLDCFVYEPTGTWRHKLPWILVAPKSYQKLMAM